MLRNYLRSIGQVNGYLRGSYYMVYKSLIKRVKGGKTLKIDVDIESGIIRNIVISGDFFAYPPEKLEELEEMLKGVSLSEAINIIDKYRDNLVLIGISFNDIIELLNSLMN